MPDAQALLEPWLLAFVLASGLALGCLGLLMVGHLLGESWLHPVRSELEAGARTVPLAGLLGVPLAFGLPDLYPWAASEPLAEALLPPARAAYLEPTLFIARSAAYFVLWTALAGWITRPGDHPRVAALGLALLVPTVGLAGIDWIKSRELAWWSTLYPLAFGVSQLLGAMALAILVSLVRPGHERAESLLDLSKILLSLALLALWLWFAQFLVVWLGNLPDEVAWYLVRFEGWFALNLAVLLPTLALGLVLLIPPHAGYRRLVAAAALLLAHHVAHMVWLVRPGAMAPGLHWLDPVALLAIGLLWGGPFLYGLRRRQGAPAH